MPKRKPPVRMGPEAKVQGREIIRLSAAAVVPVDGMAGQRAHGRADD